MSTSTLVTWGGLALLNLALAVLVGRVRPSRPANQLAAVLFVANGLGALAQGTLLPEFGRAGEVVLFLLNSVTLLALWGLPFLFPWRRLRRRRERLLLGGIAAFLLLNWAKISLGPPDRTADALDAVFLALFFGAPLVGALVFLEGYLGARTAIQRDQFRFFLAAYALKVVVLVGGVGDLALPVPRGIELAAGVPVAAPLAAAAGLGLRVVLLGVPLALAASWARAALGGRASPRPWEGDLFVLALLGLGFAFADAGVPLELEYLLLRPLLFAFGMLRFQLLDVELRAQWPLVATVVLASMGAVAVGAVRSAQAFGLDLAVAVAAALVGALGAGLLLVRPLLPSFLPGADAGAARARELYTAALEEAASSREHGEAEERVLRALRARLQISEKEHALLEAGAYARHGEAGGAPASGRLFLGRYRVSALLGEGGFGRTFLARDEQLGRQVVLKAARLASPAEGERVRREARILARMEHPNIVGIYDVEEVGDDCVLVLEHVEGGSLADLLAQGPLPAARALAVADDVLAALEAAHAEGVIHRDIKPANILLGRDGRAKLADFGVARAAAGSGTASRASNLGRHPGSLLYMSPEQVRGGRLDARSDLYSVGVVLYEMLAGRPYLRLRGRGEFEVRMAILDEGPTLPLDGTPAGLNRLLAAALAKDVDHRPESAAAMRGALKRSLAGLDPR